MELFKFWMNNPPYFIHLFGYPSILTDFFKDGLSVSSVKTASKTSFMDAGSFNI